MRKAQAVKNKVLARIIKQESVTDGGIILPETAQNEPQSYGEVISVGEEVVGIKEGDLIMFHKSAGQDIILQRKIVKVLMVEEVYGVLKEVEDEL